VSSVPSPALNGRLAFPRRGGSTVSARRNDGPSSTDALTRIGLFVPNAVSHCAQSGIAIPLCRLAELMSAVFHPGTKVSLQSKPGCAANCPGGSRVGGGGVPCAGGQEDPPPFLVRRSGDRSVPHWVVCPQSGITLCSTRYRDTSLQRYDSTPAVCPGFSVTAISRRPRSLQLGPTPGRFWRPARLMPGYRR